jgi:hypothetical protein
MSRNRFREITKGHAPRKMVNRRTGVLKLSTARGKAYGAVIGMMDGSSRLARQKFTTDRESRIYRSALQERYEVFELSYQLESRLAARHWWRKALDWISWKLGKETYPDLVMLAGIMRSRSPSELDTSERRRLAAQIRAME